MARPREFDENTVIERAMMTFWRQGYAATTIADLETATGISRISIYNAFGDKERLFLSALEKYHADAAKIFDGAVSTNGLDGIIGLFEAISKPTPPNALGNAGCLMVNTGLELRRAGPEVRARVTAYRAMARASFAAALAVSRRRGEIDAGDPLIAMRAGYLLGLLWGALATIRTSSETAAAAAIASVGGEVIRSWRKRA